MKETQTDTQKETIEEINERLQKAFDDPIFMMTFQFKLDCSRCEMYDYEHDAVMASRKNLPRHQIPMDASYWMNKIPRPYINKEDRENIHKYIQEYDAVCAKTKDHKSTDMRDMLAAGAISQLKYYYSIYHSKEPNESN